MDFYNPDYLYLPAFVVFIFGMLVLYSYSKDIILSIVISFFKASIFYIYFSFFFDGTFTFLDDWSYLNQANRFIDEEMSANLLFEYYKLVEFFHSSHVLYQLHNVLSFKIFGAYYFSPVAINIIITFVTSYFLFNIAKLIGFSKRVSLVIAVFYLLHWDVLAWSTLFNLKDILVQLFSIILIYQIIIFENSSKNFKSLFIIILVVFCLMAIRFYLPFLIFAGYGLYKILFIVIKLKAKRKFIYMLILFILVSLFLVFINYYFQYELKKLMMNFTNPLIGIVRFILTPIPFNFEESYSFLYFASLLHWLTFPLTIYGIYISYRVNKKVMLFILCYLFIILLFYGSYGELQGPRHRLQIVPYIAMFQLIGFLSLFYRDEFNKKYIQKLKYYEK